MHRIGIVARAWWVSACLFIAVDGVAETRMADARLAGVVFKGVSAYPAETLLSLYRPDLGAVLDDALVTRFEGALAARYSTDGYLEPMVRSVVHDPSSTLIVTVREPVLRRVNVRGKEHANNPHFWSSLTAFSREQPLRRDSFARWLLQANRLDGIDVRGTMVPIEDSGSDYALELRVFPNRWSGVAHLDNRAPDVLGNELAQVQLGYRIGDERPTLLRAAAAVALDVERLKFASVSATHVLDRRGSAFEWSYSGSESRLPTVDALSRETSPNDYERARTTTGVRIPVLKRATARVDAWSTLELYDVDTYAPAGERLRKERIRTTGLGTTWSAVGNARRRHDATVAWTRGLDAIGAEVVQVAGGAPDIEFTRLEASYRLLQPIAESWTLALAMQGQATRDRLPISERFLIGGRQLGGAFDPASVTGDEGLGARIEVARSSRSPWLDTPTEAYLYYDYAASRSNEPAYDSDRAASVGLGIRLEVGRLSTYLEVAAPIIDPDTNPLADSGVRIYFSLTQRFL